MRHFERRLRKLEAIRIGKKQHWVWVHLGKTEEDAKTAYLSQHADAAETDQWLFIRWRRQGERLGDT